MSASKSLHRVLRIREAEERQVRAQMESALEDLRRLQVALKFALNKARQARALVASSVRSGERVDRIAALEEMAEAENQLNTLPARIAAEGLKVASIRQRFLSKRTERRQVESLIGAADAREASEANRNNQSALDDWHLLQRIRKKEPAGPVDSEI